MGIRTIIFDLGNVLVEYNWERYLRKLKPDERMFQRIADAMFLSPAWNENDRGVRTREETLQAFIAGAPEYEKEIRELYENLGETIQIFPYAENWVRELKEKGYRVYALSNWPENIYAQRGHNLDVLERMDGYILSYREHTIKPEPAIYERLLTRYAICPEEAVFLDDNRCNVEAAERLGIHGIVFTSKEEAEKELKKLGV